MVKNNGLIIEQSHKRSEDYGVEKNTYHSRKVLNNDQIETLLKVNRYLVEVATPYINMINSALNNEDFIVVLTDNEGCILYIDGQESILNEFSKIDLVIGAYMDEKSIGTNAMGTAIKEDRPIQITANEHYIKAFQSLTCSAAPIHDDRGKIIGTLNLTGNSDKKHPHTLGLVIVGVKAIENEIDKEKAKNVLNETYNYMESIIDNVSKGVMIIDNYGKIKNINKLGEKIFNKEKDMLIDRDVSTIVSDWYNILDKFENGEKSYTKEVKVKHSSKYKTVLDFKPVNFKDKIVGMVVLMTNQEDIISECSTNTGAFYDFDDIIGSSAIIKNTITNCKIISNSPSTVLIEGESGTGKEILAQSIHNYSYRRNNKFVAINCGAIPTNIIESELFGYEEGTFTGGKKGGRKGKIELANGGTLFLDEIGEMPLDMQVNLLRFLQEGRITRLGGDKEIAVDVRIIAATNKDLKKEILKGNFREDLYYRLCVIPIKVPSLRERKGDIEELINYFIRIKSLKLNKSILNISDAVYDTLINYNWPGNVRQLENYIESLVNLDGKLCLDLLNEEEIVKKSRVKFESEETSELVTLEEMERRLILKTVRCLDNNMTKVARQLGIGRNTLYAKMRKYDIY
ncbi:Transcriptional regulator containing PAS, AAA-type ATPase, and DNA-binding Fis domains [Clostridium cavendishii DSM 21758]|uniref:Transcriptional regulator containing PAS, AAA-type ATPase, and DNA-binding Fis domains n=1 Tax=Clostridium cavendishii DSM 21758 TaxID=1121302 RepID=A0A1M6TI58_9CLOT|nr:sigma 54-interacting transcriptional regulator [Clostridium cavendishii]SHK56448.1 Transcriptional regulator containing PAS, AAA-type ATPase, and DNA-binding Fis domains [Clostridium cavendishii DSM 21758]